MAQLLGAQHTAPPNVKGETNQPPGNPGSLVTRCPLYFIIKHLSNAAIRDCASQWVGVNPGASVYQLCGLRQVV